MCVGGDQAQGWAAFPPRDDTVRAASASLPGVGQRLHRLRRVHRRDQPQPRQDASTRSVCSRM